MIFRELTGMDLSGPDRAGYHSHMPPTIEPNSDDTMHLIRRAIAGDSVAWNAIVLQYGPRLRRTIRLRLDPRLAGVIDPADVMQETYQLIHDRLTHYLETPKHPFFIWLRYVAGDALARVHRRHLHTKKRNPGVALQLFPEASSINLAGLLVGRERSPDSEVLRKERCQRVIDALDSLSIDDREVLVLRHFEQLTAIETATLLGISESAARKRYLRALARITDLLKGSESGLGALS
jgi:RNA polymerase sigma-70 factor (ECF subfamily)